MSLLDAIHCVRDDIVNELHTMLPGKIVKYDPATQLCDVQLMCKRVYYSNEQVGNALPGQKIYASHPVIGNVPVLFPGGSGFSITWPLGAGDDVVVQFSEASLADYLSSGDESAQQQVGRHKLEHALVYPIYMPAPTPSTDGATTGNTSMMLGQSGGVQIRIDPSGGVTIDAAPGITLGAGASDYVALASKVDTALSDLATWVKTGLQAFAPTGAPAPLTFPAHYSPDSVASALVKSK